jgi:hypothetical protein
LRLRHRQQALDIEVRGCGRCHDDAHPKTTWLLRLQIDAARHVTVTLNFCLVKAGELGG